MVGQQPQNIDFLLYLGLLGGVASVGDDLDREGPALVLGLGGPPDDSEAALAQFGVAVDEKLLVLSLERGADEQFDFLFHIIL